MKTLIQHIAEKLIINKNYKIDNSITSLIDVLFDNIDEEDTTWKPEKDDIIPYWVIHTMIYDNLPQFLARQQRDMITNACEAFKILPDQIYRTKYVRAIIKQHITENYADECNELLKITDKCFTNKEVKLITDNVMRLSMNEQYTMLFLYNKTNNVIMAIFIMEFKD
jgi:hypothetical protein